MRTLPLILTLDQHGVPHRWVTWQQAVWYYAKERVAWEVGSEAFTVYGGHSHRTGERSHITANSIIAIRGKALAIKGFNQVPPLNNRELFHRVPHVQPEEGQPHAGRGTHAAAVRALRAEPRGVPDPRQSPHPRRPDGVPAPARLGEFAPSRRREARSR